MKNFWNGLSPRTRQIVVIVIGLVIVAGMYLGVIDKELITAVTQ